MKRKILAMTLLTMAVAIFLAPASQGKGSQAVAQTASLGTGSAKARSGIKYYAQGTPTRAIQELDDMLEDFHIGTNLTAKQEEENRALKKKIIHGTFDVRELSRLALSKHWSEIGTQEQDHFVQLLTDLLEEKALFSKEQLAAKSKTQRKYRILYRGHKYMDPKELRSFVRTVVIVPTENIDIRLNYKLKRQDGDWKIFDVIVDNASLVDNYRYQFDSIIRKHGYADLVRRMTDKLDEIKSKRREKNGTAKSS